MARRSTRDPSPVKAAFAHTALGLIAFGSAAGAFALGVNTFGDEGDASPVEIIALFDESQRGAAPILKARLEGPDRRETLMSAKLLEEVEEDEPSLGVDYAESPAPEVEQGDGGAASIVRINGHAVRPGQSLSDVVSKAPLPRAPLEGLHERSRAGLVPKISDDGSRPDTAYAKPFSNPEGKPAVSLVIGGLGINRTHTASAIDELPPEVTLSFVPYASGLQTWINRARAAGHEVLIEVPMEPLDYGRLRPHPQTLTVSAGPAVNATRLDWALSRATGVFGVINQEGGKFAVDDSATAALVEALAGRGMALVEDGSIEDSVFGAAATGEGLKYVAAERVIDQEASAAEIDAQLLSLETSALKSGSALATGFAYPVTIDTVKAWASRLEAKGIVLAPASSALSKAKPAVSKVTSVSGAPRGGDPAP